MAANRYRLRSTAGQRAPAGPGWRWRCSTRPTSCWASPNAEILVLREDGSPCAPDEPGELVHRGALVSMGYWNDPDKTALKVASLLNQSGEFGFVLLKGSQGIEID